MKMIISFYINKYINSMLFIFLFIVKILNEKKKLFNFNFKSGFNLNTFDDDLYINIYKYIKYFLFTINY